jgi:carbamoyl-phosphate synthase small subunit
MGARLAHLVLEDGTTFSGRAVGAPGVAAGEACFTTAMAGYEEAVTDPSFAAQVLAFAYPLIGNYGVDTSRMESGRVWTEGVVARRMRPELAGWLAEQDVVALEEVDTRALVRHLRSAGAMRCALGEAAREALLERALAEPHIEYERALAEPERAHPPLGLLAGTSEPYTVGAGPTVAVGRRRHPRARAACGAYRQRPG